MIAFSREGYAGVIEAARSAGYRFAPVGEAMRAGPGPTMLLRHDVDFDLETAAELGELEAGLGVRSTYFVLVGGDFYSATDRAGRAAIRRLVEAGHEIGLHYDTSGAGAAGPVEHVRLERDLLGGIAGRPVVSASQHIPTDSAYVDIAGLFEVETYSQDLKARYAYVADSSMRWRGQTPLDLIPRGVDVQFNAHPLWWICPGDTADEKLRWLCAQQGSARAGRYEQFIAYMRHVLENRAAYDRKFAEARAGER